MPKYSVGTEWKPRWLETRARHRSVFDSRDGTRSPPLQLAWWKTGHLEGTEYFWSSMKHFFFIIFTCVYLKGTRGFNTGHWEGHNEDNWDYFLFTSNIPNEYNVRGQQGGMSPLLEAFLFMRRIKVVVVALDAENRLCRLIQAAATLGRTCRLYDLLTLSLTPHGCNGKYLIPCDNLKRWNKSQKHYCGRVWYVSMLKYPEAPRHT